MTKLHNDEVDIDILLVKRLVAEQFPHWSDLEINAIQATGTENAIFRLGDGMAVRMPRIASATVGIDKQAYWLPKLAPHLSLDIPVPLGHGKPGAGYPFPWSVYTWLAGEPATRDRIDDLGQAAQSLAQFVAALQRIDATEGPAPGEHNFGRGVPLAERDAQTQAAIADSRGLIDTDLASTIWQASLDLPVWTEPPVWIHGDLQSGNLLAHEGQLTAVIDFGGLGVGDPACDLQVAWNLLSKEARVIFREALQVDEAMWLRGRAWALSVAVIALPYYQVTNPFLAEISRYTINEVFADYRTS